MAYDTALYAHACLSHGGAAMSRKVASLKVALTQVEAQIRQAAIEASRAAVQKQVEHLTNVVRTWKNRPTFSRSEKQRRGKTTVSLVIEGDEEAIAIFGYVDRGTKPHIIRPVRAKRLAFRSQYSAKTTPIANFDVGTGRATGPMQYRAEVNHPGNEARDFVAFAMLEAEDDFEQAIDELRIT